MLKKLHSCPLKKYVSSCMWILALLRVLSSNFGSVFGLRVIWARQAFPPPTLTIFIEWIFTFQNEYNFVEQSATDFRLRIVHKILHLSTCSWLRTKTRVAWKIPHLGRNNNKFHSVARFNQVPHFIRLLYSQNRNLFTLARAPLNVFTAAFETRK